MENIEDGLGNSINLYTSMEGGEIFFMVENNIMGVFAEGGAVEIVQLQEGFRFWLIRVNQSVNNFGVLYKHFSNTQVSQTTPQPSLWLQQSILSQPHTSTYS